MKREKGEMNPGLAQSIPRMLKDSGVERLYITGMGEPLLYSHLVEFIQEASRVGLPTHLFTNGYLLDRDFALGLYRAGLSVMGISLHTSSETSFRELRPGRDSFCVYLSRVKSAVKTKLEFGCSTEIRIYLMCTSTSGLFGYKFKGAINNKEEATNEVMEWFLWGQGLCDELGLRSPSGFSANINPHLFNIPILPGVSVVSKLLLPWGKNPEDKIPALVGACRGLQMEFGILYNGDVTMCCEDYEGATALGNLGKESLGVIFSKKYTQRSKRLLKFCIPPTSFCRKCRGGVNFRMWVAMQLGSIVHHKLGIRIGGW